MAIKLEQGLQKEAVASIQRYLRDNFDAEAGSLQAESLLHFFLEEVGPLVYNSAIHDAQEQLQSRVAELDIDCHEEPFGYWSKNAKRR
ncbi:hypothetical protein PMI16_00220 [Herbaspirillum sp. CF444]|uniref:DUF2164 domain-containing protein n=1 Tax=Herbaspirillum sp. CF444 TaxID=1144319 RepID=UPI0002723F88|nr:DUF2164 domain-containing protein [Herbaspirillum sp. CF444]EJL94449.1 hypothetical protein PMI16_00220 [Herbaspirillum sp. CF444]